MNSNINRRQLLASAAALISSARLLRAEPPKFKGPIGVELYTVRSVVDQDMDGVIRRIAEIGYTEAEAQRPSLAALAPVLSKYKIAPVSCHLESGLVTGGKTAITLDEAIAQTKQLGVKHLIYPYLPPAERGGPDVMKKFADKMNETGAKVSAAGLKFGYHNHAFEFGGDPGQRPIDIFVERFDPKHVLFQVDVFWISVAGNDPVEWIGRLKNRVLSVHLKDKPAAQPDLYAENVPKETFKEVGHGSLDFQAIVKAARAVGVKNFFVEQDQTPGDPVASLAESYKYLRS